VISQPASDLASEALFGKDNAPFAIARSGGESGDAALFQVTQGIRQDQKPFPDGNLFGQDEVHQIRRALVQAPSQTTRARNPPSFATESHEMPFVTRVAVHLCEDMRENAAGQKPL